MRRQSALEAAVLNSCGDLSTERSILNNLSRFNDLTAIQRLASCYLTIQSALKQPDKHAPGTGITASVPLTEFKNTTDGLRQIPIQAGANGQRPNKTCTAQITA